MIMVLFLCSVILQTESPGYVAHFERAMLPPFHIYHEHPNIAVIYFLTLDRFFRLHWLGDSEICSAVSLLHQVMLVGLFEIHPLYTSYRVNEDKPFSIR